MIGTLLSIVIALFLYFSHIGTFVVPNIEIMGVILIAVATLFLFLPTLALALSWAPLQHAEQHLTPRISEFFRKDRHIKIAHTILLLFPLLSYVLAIDVLFLQVFSRNVVLSLWIVLLGIALDALYFLIKRISSYLDPFYLVDILVHESNVSIQQDRELDLCYYIDALAEIGIRAIQRTSMSLCSHVVDAMQKVIKVFFESSKSIGHVSTSDGVKALGISDKISYTLFFLLQRLELINDKAAEQKLEPVCSNIVIALGKIVISSAKFDITVTNYPLHFLGRITLKSQDHGLTEVGHKAILTLLEVAKGILTEIDVTYLELKDPFFTLISQMHEIEKKMFKQDKTIKVQFLIQPFLELKELFQNEKMASHQDTAVIIQDINRVLAEFAALEEVLRSMPLIPQGEDDEGQ